MADKPNYRVNRGDIKISERVALAAVGQSILRSQKFMEPIPVSCLLNGPQAITQARTSMTASR